MNKYKWMALRDMLIDNLNNVDCDNDIELSMIKNIMILTISKFFETEEITNDNINIMNNYNWSKKKEK